jgi:hypothetical protein
LGVALASIISVTSASANDILVSQQPWGTDNDVNNFNDVFGLGNYTFYNSFAAATPGGIFNPGNSFVFLEGGDGSDAALQAYLTANSVVIQAWVAAGGHLIVQSAGWTTSIVLGPYTLNGPTNYSNCGTLT